MGRKDQSPEERRSFLKKLGVGAAAAPILGLFFRSAEAKSEPAALPVEAPKVAPVPDCFGAPEDVMVGDCGSCAYATPCSHEEERKAAKKDAEHPECFGTHDLAETNEKCGGCQHLFRCDEVAQAAHHGIITISVTSAVAGVEEALILGPLGGARAAILDHDAPASTPVQGLTGSEGTWTAQAGGLLPNTYYLLRVRKAGYLPFEESVKTDRHANINESVSLLEDSAYCLAKQGTLFAPFVVRVSDDFRDRYNGPLSSKCVVKFERQVGEELVQSKWVDVDAHTRWGPTGVQVTPKITPKVQTKLKLSSPGTLVVSNTLLVVARREASTKRYQALICAALRINVDVPTLDMLVTGSSKRLEPVPETTLGTDEGSVHIAVFVPYTRLVDSTLTVSFKPEIPLGAGTFLSDEITKTGTLVVPLVRVAADEAPEYAQLAVTLTPDCSYPRQPAYHYRARLTPPDMLRLGMVHDGILSFQAQWTDGTTSVSSALTNVRYTAAERKFSEITT